MPVLPSILLVDDDYTTSFLNTKLLQRLDAAEHVLTAGNGREALEVLRTHCQAPTPRCPTLILLDLNMPVMDGFEFLEAYQHLPSVQRQGQVIVLLTTSVSPRDLARVQDLPVAAFLPKPLTAEKVTQLLVDYFPTAGH
jgi:CheY-like chemotaxis protein